VSSTRTGNHRIPTRLGRSRIESPRKLELSKPGDIDRAAEALAQGKFGLAHFGNIIGLFCEPSVNTVGDMNEFKGSERFKPVSVTARIDSVPLMTERGGFSGQLPYERAVAIASDLSAYGPVGYILPASGGIPEHLSVTDSTGARCVKTVQIITAGATSPFNDFIGAAVSRLPVDYFAATSANMSSHSAGGPQPVHYRMKQALGEFIDRGADRFFVLADPAEKKLSIAYPYHDARSTTIVRLIDVSRDKDCAPVKDSGGRYVLEIARWGSMDRSLTEKVLAAHGYGAKFLSERLDKRYYA
jgi:hypothetical protein